MEGMHYDVIANPAYGWDHAPLPASVPLSTDWNPNIPRSADGGVTVIASADVVRTTSPMSGDAGVTAPAGVDVVRTTSPLSGDARKNSNAQK